MTCPRADRPIPRTDRRRPARPGSLLGRFVPRGAIAAGVAVIAIHSAAIAGATPLHASPPPPDDTRADLERIGAWIASGEPDQRAAAERELADRIGVDEILDLHAFLGGDLPPAVRRPLLGRLHELARTLLRDVENSIESFGTARTLARELTEELSGLEPPPPERLEELTDRRTARRKARERVEQGHEELRRLGLALAPVLFHRREQGAVPSALVERFHRHLWDELEAEARRLYPRAPSDGAIREHESRSLVPLIAALEPTDPEGWSRTRRRLVDAALERIETLRPEPMDEGRALLLELGPAAQPRLEAWACDPGDWPPELAARVAEWNRLRVPPGFERRTALGLGRYGALSRAERLDRIHRLEFVGPDASAAVLHGIVLAEDDVALKVEAAAILARLGDPRGVTFLQNLGLERAIELEAISRRVLLIEALQRREAGDEQGALDALLDILRRIGGDFRLHYEIAFTALRLRRLELSIEHFERAIALDPRDPITHYNLACALALAEEPDRALDELEQAIELGYRDPAHTADDPDLESLRELPRFRDLLEKMR